MKKNNRRLYIFFILFSAISLAAAFVQGDPIPGVDVSIEQSPGGIIIATTRTDNNGKFAFKNIPKLKEGLKYNIKFSLSKEQLKLIQSKSTSTSDNTERRGHGVATGRQGGSFLTFEATFNSVLQNTTDSKSKHNIAKQQFIAKFEDNPKGTEIIISSDGSFSGVIKEAK